MIDALPPRIAERTRRVGEAGSANADESAGLDTGRYVIYWMRTASRGHDNPALDAALTVARALGLPVFVYHALSERYPYASDRHHTFILEGARDVQAELARRGIGYAFHLERPGHRGPHLKTLSDGAACVVTEDMPVTPLDRWTQRLADSIPAPVYAVDTACILPMRLTSPGQVDRAYVFRSATQKARSERLTAGWTDASPSGPAFVPALPFEPLDLSKADLAARVAECEIDHSVGPVPHSPGGQVAGYARWAAFRDLKLSRYARDRNDPLRNGVSRMSPYLHYGHVSPFRLAREALDHGSRGAEKFLDELLIWRELSHAFCFHRPDHATIDALPDWARASLRESESDPRSALLPMEATERAQTGDALWDAAQRSLRIHGELHNNVRMTWGKALLGWTRTAEDALQRTLDLNHRYALDGRDPNSYGGILWCFGRFDRPFDPPRLVTGRVRDRTTARHAERLSVPRYAARTGRPARATPPRVAVVGSGMAGLTCARALGDHGFPVVVFDKGRRPGGRMSTREHPPYQFDHGAQYFSARDARFLRQVSLWEECGVVEPWNGTVVRLDREGRATPKPGTRYVGRPGMQSLPAHLAEGEGVRSRVEVAQVRGGPGRWALADREGGSLGTYDIVVLAVPAPQALDLTPADSEIAERVSGVRMEPCWATMLVVPGGIDPGFDAAFADDEVLAWVARDSAKPGRPQGEQAGESWVLHAARDWSVAFLEAERAEVGPILLKRFSALLGRPVPCSFQRSHRWRYASPSTPLGASCLFDADLGIGACGDWCLAGRVEGAYLSGAAMAGRILGLPTPAQATEEQGSLFDGEAE